MRRSYCLAKLGHKRALRLGIHDDESEARHGQGLSEDRVHMLVAESVADHEQCRLGPSDCASETAE